MSARDTGKIASMRTPLARVRRLGSAHSGTSDFFRQRVTAVAMALLIIPVVVIVLMLTGRDQAAARALLGSPIVAILLTLFIIAGCVHMKIGVQVVIEDYVHGEATKLLAIIANNFFSFAVGLASIFAILKLAVGS
jgi:succinate dehydrogenase / fumarate reductase membrane anchor subunit